MSLNDLKIGKPDLGSYTCEINMEMQRWVVSEEELYLHTIDNEDGIGCSAEEPHQHHDQADDREAPEQRADDGDAGGIDDQIEHTGGEIDFSSDRADATGLVRDDKRQREPHKSGIGFEQVIERAANAPGIDAPRLAPLVARRHRIGNPELARRGRRLQHDLDEEEHDAPSE